MTQRSQLITFGGRKLPELKNSTAMNPKVKNILEWIYRILAAILGAGAVYGAQTLL
jgi:heme A synthase